MAHIATVQSLFSFLYFLLGLVLAHFIVFAVVGIFAKKTYPKTEKKLNYGVIIPARNEEAVVSGLIRSIQRNNYPQENLKIFVIAHNCTDQTAKIARKEGAVVYEYQNPDENTMGYAFRRLFSLIDRDFGLSGFDGFFLFNADNVLDKDYISRMNDAFVYYNKENIITSFRNSKNFGANLISGLYGMYFAVGCRLESRGRTVAGCSTRVQGTGYLINSDIVKDGWKYVTLAEDWEFSADQVLLSHNIRYCDDAVFYDEQPTSVRIMWRQRLRWSRGHLIVFYTRIKDLIKGIVSPKTKNRGSVYDICANVLPSTIFFLFLQVIQVALYLVVPLFDSGVSVKEVFLGNTASIFSSNGFLFAMLRSGLSSYFTMMLSAVLIFLVERKRIKKIGFFKKVLVVLCWPLFLIIQFLIDVQALFSLNLTWKPIPHHDKTTFEQVNEETTGT